MLRMIQIDKSFNIGTINEKQPSPKKAAKPAV